MELVPEVTSGPWTWTMWSDAITGEWCARCALPSMVAVDWVRSKGLATDGIQRAHQCLECGAFWWEEIT